MKIALFVEGGMATPTSRQKQTPLEAIWGHLARAIGHDEGFSTVIPISKKHLVAMDPAKPKMSGAGEGLDMLMARKLKGEPFDAAMVAWDLVPAWNPEGTFCRWQETLDVYRLLAASTLLPRPWSDAAQRRYDSLRSRPVPGLRHQPHRAGPHEVLAVCMEPMFEALVIREEHHVLRALDIAQRPPGWPVVGWGGASLRPDAELLRPMIRALRTGPRKRRPRVTKIVGADERNKDPWLEYLLRKLLEDEDAREVLLQQSLCRRLMDCLVAS